MNASSSVKCFCLCVSDYLECSCPDVANCPKCTKNWIEPLRKQMNLSLKGKNKKDRNCQLQNKENEPDPRFEFLTKEEMDKLQEGYKPDNTTKTTKWPVNNFQAWRVARNKVQEKSAQMTSFGQLILPFSVNGSCYLWRKRVPLKESLTLLQHSTRYFQVCSNMQGGSCQVLLTFWINVIIDSSPSTTPWIVSLEICVPRMLAVR